MVVKTGFRALRYAALAALMTGLPLLAFLVRFGVAAPLSLFQADAFYYLDLTRNSAGRPGFTFDGVYQTNGFHPVWQWLLSFARWIGWLHFQAPSRVLNQVFVLDVVLLSVAAGLFTALSVKHVRYSPLALLVAAPGLLWFAAALITPAYLSTWSYANGMESAVSLLLMAGALLLCRPDQDSLWRDLLFSTVLGLAVLARLDDIFFACALFGWALRGVHLPLRRLAAWVAPMVALVAAYVTYNKLQVGVFLPLSGMEKTSFAALGNLAWAGKLVVPMLTRNPPAALGLAAPDSFAAETIRAFQTVVPALIALAELLAIRRRKQGFGLLQALCAGVLLKAGYNFFFVNRAAQGFWYYTVSVSVANLVLVVWLDRLAQRIAPASLRRPAVWLPAYLILSLFSFSAFYGLLSVATPSWPAQLLRDGPRLAATLEAGGDHCFTEINDGSISYALGLPAEAGLGLALDLQASQALKAGRLLPLLVQRGCSLVIAVPGYSEAVESYVHSRAWQQGASLFPLQAREFASYTLTPLGTLEGGNLALFRIRALPAQAHGMM